MKCTASVSPLLKNLMRLLKLFVFVAAFLGEQRE